MVLYKAQGAVGAFSGAGALHAPRGERSHRPGSILHSALLNTLD